MFTSVYGTWLSNVYIISWHLVDGYISTITKGFTYLSYGDKHFFVVLFGAWQSMIQTGKLAKCNVLHITCILINFALFSPSFVSLMHTDNTAAAWAIFSCSHAGSCSVHLNASAACWCPLPLLLMIVVSHMHMRVPHINHQCGHWQCNRKHTHSLFVLQFDILHDLLMCHSDSGLRPKGIHLNKC